jgi:hypothetical protein
MSKTNTRPPKVYGPRQCQVHVQHHVTRLRALVPQIDVNVKQAKDAHMKHVYWLNLVSAIDAPWRQLVGILAVLLVCALIVLLTLPDVPLEIVAVTVTASVGAVMYAGWCLVRNTPYNSHVVHAYESWHSRFRASIRWNVTCDVRMFQSWHLDWFLQCVAHMPDQFAPMLRLFPNTKEVTESVAAFRVIDGLLALSNTREAKSMLNAEPTLAQERILVVVVGDGSTCRTASLFAAMTTHNARCDIHSIDPAMHDNLLDAHQAPSIRHLADHLTCHKTTIEEWINTYLQNLLDATHYDRIVLAAVHSHALFPNYVPHIRKETIRRKQQLLLVAIPCCVPQEFDTEELARLHLESVRDQDDWGIMSIKRRVCVWRSKDDRQELGME